MGLKQFNLDLRAATSSYNDPHVTNVRKGDSDGEIVFTYGLEGQPPLEIQALSTGMTMRYCSPDSGLHIELGHSITHPLRKADIIQLTISRCRFLS